MAVTGPRIRALRLRCPDPAATAAFYRRAFGCTEAAGDAGAGAEEAVALGLGAQRIALLPAARTTRRDFAGPEAGFQHFAIVVAEMAAAMRRLEAAPGWTPISRQGPETLPPASGGVTAFKFRDPDGHPLEFLAFPPGAVPAPWRAATGLFAGIDHSAIAVADTARAAAFYADLGFAAGRTGVNRGEEQARLDGMEGAVVEVTPLHLPGDARPHLELLRYRHPAPGPACAGEGDPAATELLLALPGGGAARRVTDPDGHRLVLLLDGPSG